MPGCESLHLRRGSLSVLWWWLREPQGTRRGFREGLGAVAPL